MRFLAVFTTFGLMALASAQTESSATGSRTSSAAVASGSVSPEVACLEKCGSADICCQAACVNVPCPDQGQVNATTECAGQCPQGNGSAADTQRYASCQASCISSFFLSSTAATAAATGGSSATTTGSGSAAATGSASGIGGSAASTRASASSGSASASATGSSSGSSNDGSSIRLGAVGAGFLALIIAGMAL